MKNSLYTVKDGQYDLIKRELLQANDIYTVSINGENIQTWDAFLDVMINEFRLPMGEHKNANAYLDWMRDLEWLDKNGYVLIIENYSKFMKDNSKIKKVIINDFEEIILPFWESEVENVVIGGKKKSFNVYLVD